jgi:hypothetical protein
MTTLTTTQQLILDHAAKYTDGKLVWFPDNLKGGAKSKVISSMLKSALITTDGTDYFVAAEGYDALGLKRPGQPTETKPAEEVLVAGTEETKPAKTTTPRENSKQAQVVAMLKRTTGATISQIMEATGWQKHTVRGTLAGALKKKLGLTITSIKNNGTDRVYYIN